MFFGLTSVDLHERDKEIEMEKPYQDEIFT